MGDTHLAIDAFPVVEDGAELPAIFLSFEFDLFAVVLAFETNFDVDGGSGKAEEGRHWEV
jgi:hypothetical protein